MIPRNLLWIDCLGGLCVGAGVLALHGWLAEFYGLPRELLLIIGAANALYGSYSLSLAVRSVRPRPALVVLVAANATWSLVCIGLTVSYFSSASVFGIAALVAEAVFVGGLAALEWRWLDTLSGATATTGVHSGGSGRG